MMTIRRAVERHHERRRRQEAWLTFYPPDRADPLADGFGALEILNEDRLPPGAGLPRHPSHDGEIFTYVHEGALAHEDASTGRVGVIQAGEFHCMTTRIGVRHTEVNASKTNWAHVFQLWLRPPEEGLEPNHDQKRFCTAERRGLFCVVASPDGEKGSLRLHQDARIYSAMLSRGQHVMHELPEGRDAWIHIVQGEGMFSGLVMSTGDGAGISAERAISFTARAETEVLLLDFDATILRARAGVPQRHQ